MIEAKLFAYELLEELKRDLPFLDFASLALPADEAEACVVAKAEGILAGAEEAAEFLKLLGFQLTKTLQDGARVKPGDEVMCFKGPARDIPKVERTLLNLLMHASGSCDLHKEARRLGQVPQPVAPRGGYPKDAPASEVHREEGGAHRRGRSA
jgi:nicotinate-nucleotide pyrophosphorylase